MDQWTPSETIAVLQEAVKVIGALGILAGTIFTFAKTNKLGTQQEIQKATTDAVLQQVLQRLDRHGSQITQVTKDFVPSGLIEAFARNTAPSAIAVSGPPAPEPELPAPTEEEIAAAQAILARVGKDAPL